MKITLGQIFQIGSILITLVGSLASLFYDDATLVAEIFGSILLSWNSIGAVLLNNTAQAKAVADDIDNPLVKALVVPAVANLAGVESIQTNGLADRTLSNLAASDTVKNSKIVSRH
jgi:hypothetical protein